ncbi:response regulator transcription factor [Streptomyces sp. NPDC048644]|uniref:response regulator transcription factor n=1 Tax=Streptomyces sp. NPDC048644 TaxID=3365582 RepID=UPI00371CB99B
MSRSPRLPENGGGVGQEAAGPQLTRREIEVTQAVAAGLSNRRIGRQLGISECTVKVHIRSIFIKLDVSTRTEAAVLALRDGHIAMQGPAGDA